MISRLSRLSRRLKADKYIQIPENCKRHGKRHGKRRGKRRGMLGTEPDCYGHSAPWHWGPHQAPWRGAWGVCSDVVKSCEILRFHIFWVRIQDQSLKSSRRLEAIADACGEKKKEDAATPSPCEQKLPCTTANLLQVSTNRKSIDHTAHTKWQVDQSGI